jgi:small conductance mechanosensitive channel
MDWPAILTTLQTTATQFGLKVIGALLLYAIGRRLIGFAIKLVTRGLTKRNFEPTLLGFIASAIAVALNISLVVAILGYFGVETTTFAALLAGAGIAIGSAWGGLLANFAAGAFLVVMRPFKVGDFISAGGISGTVETIGLFATTFNTGDNVRAFVGNNKLFGDNILNYSANDFRRVDLVAQISDKTKPEGAIAALKQRVLAIPNVRTEPAPDVVVQGFSPAGPLLAVRPYCHNNHYWQVYFDTNLAIREIMGDGAFPAPMPTYMIKNA